MTTTDGRCKRSRSAARDGGVEAAQRRQQLNWTELRSANWALTRLGSARNCLPFWAPRFSCGSGAQHAFAFLRSLFLFFFFFSAFWSTSFVCFNFSARALQFWSFRNFAYRIRLNFALFLIIDTAALAAVTHTHNNNKKEEGNKKINKPKTHVTYVRSARRTLIK